MTVIIANNTPPVVRGVLQRWFVEPRPNVFVSSISAKCQQKTIEFLSSTYPGWGAIIIRSMNTSQGFTVESLGHTKVKPTYRSGHFFIDTLFSPITPADLLGDTQEPGLEPP